MIFTKSLDFEYSRKIFSQMAALQTAHAIITNGAATALGSANSDLTDLFAASILDERILKYKGPSGLGR